MNRNWFGFSTQNTDITSKPDSFRENDKEGRLSDEDNHPLSDRLKERIQNKLMQKQRNAKKSGMKTCRTKKRGQSTSKCQKSNKKHKEKQHKDTSTIPATKYSQSVVDISIENFPTSDSLMDKPRKRKINVVISSSDEEIPIDNISHPIPFTRRVTRIMMKKRCQTVQ